MHHAVYMGFTSRELVFKIAVTLTSKLPQGRRLKQLVSAPTANFLGRQSPKSAHQKRWDVDFGKAFSRRTGF